MEEHFRSLWKYNDWANRKVLEKLEANGSINKKGIALISHVLSAQFIWHLRITKKPTSVFPAWAVYKLSELFTMNEDSSKNWLTLLNKNNDYSTEYAYQDLKGATHKSTLEQIFTHVINHGTHHRAQIVALLRQENVNPPILDYIAYSRL